MLVVIPETPVWAGKARTLDDKVWGKHVLEDSRIVIGRKMRRYRDVVFCLTIHHTHTLVKKEET